MNRITGERGCARTNKPSRLPAGRRHFPRSVGLPKSATINHLRVDEIMTFQEEVMEKAQPNPSPPDIKAFRTAFHSPRGFFGKTAALLELRLKEDDSGPFFFGQTMTVLPKVIIQIMRTVYVISEDCTSTYETNATALLFTCK